MNTRVPPAAAECAAAARGSAAVFISALAAALLAAACYAAPPNHGGKDMATAQPAQPAPTQAVRLIFEYEGDQVRLISQQPVDMAVTGFDLARVPHPGVYVDARDDAGATLARVAARHAFEASAEVFPEQPGGAITRVDVAKPKGAFTVVVPAPAAARKITVVRVAGPQPGVQAPAGGATSRSLGAAQVTDLATFDLKRHP